MTIRGVLLDKDGTILDYWRTWVPINREAALFAAGGDARLAAELLALGGHDPASNVVTPGTVLAAGTHDEIAGAFASGLGHRTPPDLAAGIERIFREGGAKYSVLIDGAEAALDRLAAMGLVLGVATNDSAGGLQASLGRHPGLLERFAFLCGCDSGFGAKPEPGMVEAFCRHTGLSPTETAMVGDAAHDLEMGRRANVGLKVGVLGGTSVRGDLEPYADIILDSVAALPGWLAAAGLGKPGPGKPGPGKPGPGKPG